MRLRFMVVLRFLDRTHGGGDKTGYDAADLGGLGGHFSPPRDAP